MPRHGLSPASSHALSSRFHDALNLRVRRGKRRSRTSTRLAIESLESRQLLSTYTIEDLGTLGGNSSLANAINAEGQVVGSAQLANGTSHAVVWNPGQPGKDLGTLGGTTSTALGINILGDVVGNADTTTDRAQPFEVPSGGSMTDLTNAPPENSLATLLSARGVSDTGVIVGQGFFNAIDTFVTVPYAFDPASGTILGLDDTFDAIGEAVAVGGTRAVSNLNTNGISQAVVGDINTPDASVPLPAITNQTQSVATGISAPNSTGTQFASGFALDSSGSWHAVLWTIPTNANLATVSDLGHVTGATDQGTINREARGANSLGDVVGNDVLNLNTVAWVKDHAGAITLLSTLLPAGSGITLEEATGINDAGQICATGIKDGKEHAFRLTPVPVAPPQARLTTAPNVTGFGATSYSFVVTYTDGVGIDATTLANAIQVTGPANFSQTASLTTTSGNPKNLTATYTINAPGGTWDFTDDGTYTVTLKNNVVKSTAGTSIVGGTLGHFVAAVAPVRGSISGTVFNDANANGTRDAGEGGVPSTDVFLDLNGNSKYDAGDRLSVTDANGAYTFGGLLPSIYRVMELVVPPHAVISPRNDLDFATVTPAQDLTGQDFADVADPQLDSIVGQNLAQAHGSTPQFDQDGTLIQIIGRNFVPGSVFYFGNNLSATQPINLVADPSGGLQSFGVRVSTYATTGPLVVRSPNGRETVLLSNFTVDNYRDVNGYSFFNNGVGYGDFTFDDLTRLYGADQTHISVDACGILTLGLADCTVNTGIPDPLAYLELAVINEVLPPDLGQCLGFALSSARLSLADFIPDDFPIQPGTDGSTVWDLAGPSGPSPELRDFIHQAHLEQTSVEFLENYVGQIGDDEVFGLSHLIDTVKSELAQGRPVLIPFQEGGFGGHAVLAYNVEDLPNGGEQLDIYDPNNPYETSEAPAPTSGNVLQDGSIHKAAVDASTIVFDSSGNWTYNGPLGGATGGLANIAAAPLSVFDNHTLVTSAIEGLLSKFLVFGNATETQVTDSAGHTLLNADGTPNTNPNTMIPGAARYVAEEGATPIDLIQGNGNFMQTIVGTGSGTYGAASLSPDAMAMISGVPSMMGQADRFGLNPSNDMLTFIPASNKQVNADLVINAPAGVQREAQLTSVATGGAAETLQFMGSQRDHVVLQNKGSAGMFSLNLTSNADGEVQTFTTGRMPLAAGDTVDLLPSDWADIQTATANVVVTHGDGTTATFTMHNGGMGFDLNVKEGVSFNQTVASFTGLSPAGVSANIEWGDGTTSAGTVTAVNANVVVTGSHTYAQQGYFPTRITISDSSGPLGQATGEAIVADTTFSLATANITAFAGVPFTGSVATLRDLPSGDQAGDFDVTIDWGDGTSSAGTLETTPAGTFDVRGSHTWATNGNKSVDITVTERGSASGQGHTIAITANKNFSGTVAQLQLPIPGSAPGDYAATIDWGDNTQSTGTLTLQSDGTVILAGTHTYATGNQSFVTHFTVTGGPSAKITSTAVVGNAVGTVTGKLFNDVDGNGQQNAGEGSLSGQTVFIDENHNATLDAGEPTAVTDSSGDYSIANVPAGNIRVIETAPNGFRVDAPASGFYDVTLQPGQTLAGLDFGNTQLALISGTVFLDTNVNKTLDAFETGRANRTVYLDLNDDGVLQSTEPTAITNASGAFAFNTVSPGTYDVRLEPTFGFEITTPAGGAYSVTAQLGSTSSGGRFGEVPVTLAFGNPASLATTGAKPVALVVADFNNDTKPDIATADSGGNDVTVFLNQGGGTFAAGQKVAVGNNPVGIVAGDFNGDGKTDLAVADQDDNAVRILAGAGDGTFTLATTALSAAAPNGIAAFDFNGDHTTDIVVSDRNSKQITLFLSESGGRFAAGQPIDVDSLPNAITVADVNGDTKPDLLVANGDGNGTTTHGSVSVLLGDGQGGFTSSGNFPALTNPTSLTAGDFDGDGSVDVMTANPGNSSGAILFGAGNGTFGPPAKLTPGGTPQAVASGDFNNDGLPDATFADAGSGAGANTIAVLPGRGDSSFTDPLNLTADTAPQAVAAADLNADGKLDLVTVASDTNKLLVFLNSSTTVKATPTITWFDPADIVYGTALSGTLLDATASVPGTFIYTPAAGNIPGAGINQVLTVNFTPADSTHFTTASATVHINVTKATPVLTVSAPGGAFTGAPFPAAVTIASAIPGIDDTPAPSLENVTPTLTYFEGAGTSGTSLGSTPPINLGVYTVVAHFPGSTDFAAVDSAPMSFTINRGAAQVALNTSVGSAVFGQAITIVATVTAAVTPSGTVTFSDGGTPLATVPLDGSGRATLTTADLAIGSHSITATYSGDAHFVATVSGSASESVARSTTHVVLVPQAVVRKRKVVSIGLKAEIEPVAPGGGIPTGVVRFAFLVKHRKKTKTNLLGTAALNHGQAMLTLKPKQVLNKTITVIYDGDPDYLATSLAPFKLTQSALKHLARPAAAGR